MASDGRPSVMRMQRLGGDMVRIETNTGAVIMARESPTGQLDVEYVQNADDEHDEDDGNLSAQEDYDYADADADTDVDADGIDPDASDRLAEVFAKGYDTAAYDLQNILQAADVESVDDLVNKMHTLARRQTASDGGNAEKVRLMIATLQPVLQHLTSLVQAEGMSTLHPPTNEAEKKVLMSLMTKVQQKVHGLQGGDRLLEALSRFLAVPLPSETVRPVPVAADVERDLTTWWQTMSDTMHCGGVDGSVDLLRVALGGASARRAEDTQGLSASCDVTAQQFLEILRTTGVVTVEQARQMAVNWFLAGVLLRLPDPLGPSADEVHKAATEAATSLSEGASRSYWGPDGASRATQRGGTSATGFPNQRTQRAKQILFRSTDGRQPTYEDVEHACTQEIRWDRMEDVREAHTCIQFLKAAEAQPLVGEDDAFQRQLKPRVGEVLQSLRTDSSGNAMAIFLKSLETAQIPTVYTQAITDSVWNGVHLLRTAASFAKQFRETYEVKFLKPFVAAAAKEDLDTQDFCRNVLVNMYWLGLIKMVPAFRGPTSWATTPVASRPVPPAEGGVAMELAFDSISSQTGNTLITPLFADEALDTAGVPLPLLTASIRKLMVSTATLANAPWQQNFWGIVGGAAMAQHCLVHGSGTAPARAENALKWLRYAEDLLAHSKLTECLEHGIVDPKFETRNVVRAGELRAQAVSMCVCSLFGYAANGGPSAGQALLYMPQRPQTPIRKRWLQSLHDKGDLSIGAGLLVCLLQQLLGRTTSRQVRQQLSIQQSVLGCAFCVTTPVLAVAVSLAMNFFTGLSPTAADRTAWQEPSDTLCKALQEYLEQVKKYKQDDPSAVQEIAASCGDKVREVLHNALQLYSFVPVGSRRRKPTVPATAETLPKLDQLLRDVNGAKVEIELGSCLTSKLSPVEGFTETPVAPDTRMQGVDTTDAASLPGILQAAAQLWRTHGHSKTVELDAEEFVAFLGRITMPHLKPRQPRSTQVTAFVLEASRLDTLIENVIRKTNMATSIIVVLVQGLHAVCVTLSRYCALCTLPANQNWKYAELIDTVYSILQACSILILNFTSMVCTVSSLATTTSNAYTTEFAKASQLCTTTSSTAWLTGRTAEETEAERKRLAELQQAILTRKRSIDTKQVSLTLVLKAINDPQLKKNIATLYNHAVGKKPEAHDGDLKAIKELRLAMAISNLAAAFQATEDGAWKALSVPLSEYPADGAIAASVSFDWHLVPSADNTITPYLDMLTQVGKLVIEANAFREAAEKVADELERQLRAANIKDILCNDGHLLFQMAQKVMDDTINSFEARLQRFHSVYKAQLDSVSSEIPQANIKAAIEGKIRALHDCVVQLREQVVYISRLEITSLIAPAMSFLDGKTTEASELSKQWQDKLQSRNGWLGSTLIDDMNIAINFDDASKSQNKLQDTQFQKRVRELKSVYDSAKAVVNTYTTEQEPSLKFIASGISNTYTRPSRISTPHVTYDEALVKFYSESVTRIMEQANALVITNPTAPTEFEQLLTSSNTLLSSTCQAALQDIVDLWKSEQYTDLEQRFEMPALYQHGLQTQAKFEGPPRSPQVPCKQEQQALANFWIQHYGNVETPLRSANARSSNATEQVQHLLTAVLSNELALVQAVAKCSRTGRPLNIADDTAQLYRRKLAGCDERITDLGQRLGTYESLLDNVNFALQASQQQLNDLKDKLFHSTSTLLNNYSAALMSAALQNSMVLAELPRKLLEAKTLLEKLQRVRKTLWQRQTLSKRAEFVSTEDDEQKLLEIQTLTTSCAESVTKVNTDTTESQKLWSQTTAYAFAIQACMVIVASSRQKCSTVDIPEAAANISIFLRTLGTVKQKTHELFTLTNDVLAPDESGNLNRAIEDMLCSSSASNSSLTEFLSTHKGAVNRLTLKVKYALHHMRNFTAALKRLAEDVPQTFPQIVQLRTTVLDVLRELLQVLTQYETDKTNQNQIHRILECLTAKSITVPDIIVNAMKDLHDFGELNEGIGELAAAVLATHETSHEAARGVTRRTQGFDVFSASSDVRGGGRRRQSMIDTDPAVAVAQASIPFLSYGLATVAAAGTVAAGLIAKKSKALDWFKKFFQHEEADGTSSASTYTSVTGRGTMNDVLEETFSPPPADTTVSPTAMPLGSSRRPAQQLTTKKATPSPSSKDSLRLATLQRLSKLLQQLTADAHKVNPYNATAAALLASPDPTIEEDMDDGPGSTSPSSGSSRASFHEADLDDLLRDTDGWHK